MPCMDAGMCSSPHAPRRDSDSVGSAYKDRSSICCSFTPPQLKQRHYHPYHCTLSPHDSCISYYLPLAVPLPLHLGPTLPFLTVYTHLPACAPFYQPHALACLSPPSLSTPGPPPHWQPHLLWPLSFCPTPPGSLLPTGYTQKNILMYMTHV